MGRSLVRLVVMVAALIVLFTPRESEAQEFCWIEAWCEGWCFEWGMFFDPKNMVSYRCCDLNAMETTCDHYEVFQGCCFW